MNKPFLLLAISFFFCVTMFAQSNPIELFNGNMPSPTLFEEAGNIGIGAIDPDSKLTIWSVYDRSNNLTPNAGLSVVNYNIGAGYTPISLVVSRYSSSVQLPGGTIPAFSATDFIVSNNGNVGIGTATPQTNLDVVGNVAVSGDATIGGNAAVYGNATVSADAAIGGNATIGFNTTISGNTVMYGNSKVGGNLIVGQQSGTPSGKVIIGTQSAPCILNLNSTGGGWANQLVFSDAAGPRHIITDDAGTGALTFHPGFNTSTGATGVSLFEGKVQIGTQKPGVNNTAYANYLLAVQGNIICQKNIVQITDWSDKVFDAHYPLSSLSDVESYIKENKHLPEIPTECEAIENGVDLGEMNKLLLQKVEELTLYVIKQQKQIDAILKKQ